MPKPRRLIVLGNLTVRHYVLHRNGVEVPQWVVTSKDGKHVNGPFSSLEEAIRAAKEAGTLGSEKGS
jgi:hypothetical protein